ncbi:MAG: DUF2207 domain-containing protein [Thermomicrobiales bacterium]|nr:DUF2207 domain-containing protein [Thermomicrobiales bacterium]
MVVLLLAVSAPLIALAADFGDRVPGQRVYDQTGALTADNIARIDTQAAAVEETGSPVVVFLAARDADYDETVADGRELMETWDIQSGPDQRDGVVIFLNLQPDNLDHGTYALIAGKSLIDGNLPQYELDRIASDMRPQLEDGDIAGAIILALERIERDLTLGPPPPPEPSTAERFAGSVADGAFSIVNFLGVVLAAAAGFLLSQRIPTRMTSKAPVTQAVSPPTDLSPALAGSLVAGNVTDTAIGATLLDLAARGAIAIEPDGKKKIRIRLQDERDVQPGYEQMIWSALSEQADADGIVSDKQMGKVRKSWGDVRKQIRQELIERGWFATDANERRKPYWIFAALLYGLAIIVIILAAIAKSPLALIGFVPLAFVGTIAIILVSQIPNTTVEGDQVAAPWRGYKRYLGAAGKNPQVDLDLDTAVPYALALGSGQAFNKRLEKASEAGYLPVWLGGPETGSAYTAGFYPYWVAFNSSVAPSSSGAAGSGASAGSGAAGGSF